MPERTARPLPVTIEEITTGWLTAALRTRAPNVTVRALQIVDIRRGTCTKIRLRLKVDEAGKQAGIPETVILKGGFEPHSRALHYMHEKEARAYRDVLPVLNLPSPACYFADYDTERQQGIVIMEDLVARGVGFCSALEPQSHDQVARRLTTLARFHAKTWDSPEFLPGGRWDWVDDLLLTQRFHFDQYLTPEVWPRFIASPRGAAASVRFHSREWMTGALDRMALLSPQLPKCVIHGDTHLGNLYIDRDQTPGFYDPLPTRAPGMLEITYHVAGALDTADRSRWEGALVRHYLDELGRNGVDAPGFDDAMRQYGLFLAYGYCIFIINEPIFQSEAVNTAYTARFSAAMIQHKTIELLAAVA